MSTIVADHIESLLQDIVFAAENIEFLEGDIHASPDQNDRALVEALESARRVLEGALIQAERNGLPKMAIDAA